MQGITKLPAFLCTQIFNERETSRYEALSKRLYSAPEHNSDIIIFICFVGLQLSSQLFSDLKRASTINKTHRMRYSATEEELLQSLSNATQSVPAQGIFT